MKNLDTLYTDATCYESAMRYPTDAKLLWECIEKVYPMMCEASRELGIHRMRTKYLDVSRDNMAYVKQRRHTKRKPSVNPILFARLKSCVFGMSTYLAKYLNILCHLSLDTLPFMLTYFFKGILSRSTQANYTILNKGRCLPQYHLNGNTPQHVLLDVPW